MHSFSMLLSFYGFVLMELELLYSSLVCANNNGGGAKPQHIPEKGAQVTISVCFLLFIFRILVNRILMSVRQCPMLGTGCVEQGCFTKTHEIKATQQMVPPALPYNYDALPKFFMQLAPILTPAFKTAD